VSSPPQHIQPSARSNGSRRARCSTACTATTRTASRPSAGQRRQAPAGVTASSIARARFGDKQLQSSKPQHENNGEDRNRDNGRQSRRAHQAMPVHHSARGAIQTRSTTATRKRADAPAPAAAGSRAPAAGTLSRGRHGDDSGLHGGARHGGGSGLQAREYAPVRRQDLAENAPGAVGSSTARKMGFALLPLPSTLSTVESSVNTDASSRRSFLSSSTYTVQCPMLTPRKSSGYLSDSAVRTSPRNIACTFDAGIPDHDSHAPPSILTLTPAEAAAPAAESAPAAAPKSDILLCGRNVERNSGGNRESQRGLVTRHLHLQIYKMEVCEFCTRR